MLIFLLSVYELLHCLVLYVASTFSLSATKSIQIFVIKRLFFLKNCSPHVGPHLDWLGSEMEVSGFQKSIT